MTSVHAVGTSSTPDGSPRRGRKPFTQSRTSCASAGTKPSPTPLQSLTQCPAGIYCCACSAAAYKPQCLRIALAVPLLGLLPCGDAWRALCRSPLDIRDISVGQGRQQFMHTISAGERTSPPMVVLPGYGAGSGFYFRNIDGLAQHFRLHCVDLLGTGMSGVGAFYRACLTVG